MQAVSNHSRAVQRPLQAARIAFRKLWPGRPTTRKDELRGDSADLEDAHISVRCGNPTRSWRVLSEWLRSRSDQPEDYAWLSSHVAGWQEKTVIARLAEARIARLVALRRSTEALTVAAQRLSMDPHFRPLSAADTLSLAQIAARGGAARIARILLSDFGARFPGDPRVAVSEALKRRLTEPAPARLLA